MVKTKLEMDKDDLERLSPPPRRVTSGHLTVTLSPPIYAYIYHLIISQSY